MIRQHLTVATDHHQLSGRTTLVLAAAAALTLMACGGSSGGGGVGGAPGIGGSPTTPTGGRTGAGGRGTGGMGTGGTAGSAACLTAPYTHTSAFGAILDGWVVAPNSTPPALAPTVGADGATTSGTLVEIDPSVGSPTAGSVKLTIPFDAPNEELLFAQNSGGLNMAGTTITARIKLDSGLNVGPVNVGRAFLILKTTSAYNYVAGPSVPLDSSMDFVELTINADNPQAAPPLGYDPCDVREIDVSIQTGGAGTYQTAVVHIDTIAVTRPGGTDAGTDTSTDAVTPSDATDTASTDAPAATDTAADVATDAPAATDTATDVATGG